MVHIDEAGEVLIHERLFFPLHQQDGDMLKMEFDVLDKRTLTKAFRGNPSIGKAALEVVVPKLVDVKQESFFASCIRPSTQGAGAPESLF